MEVAEEVVTIDTSDHSNEIILTNFEGLTAESVTSSQGGEQVLGYLEVQESGLDENGTIYTQEIEIDGQHLYLTQGEAGNEFIVVVSGDQDNPVEQTVAHFVQSGGVNSTTLPVQCADTKLVVCDNNGDPLVRNNVVESSIDSSASLSSVTHIEEGTEEYHESMLVSGESLNEVTVKNNSDISSSLWTFAGEKIDAKDEGTEVLFIPNTKLASTFMLSSQDERNRKLLQLAHIAQEFEPVKSIDTETEVAESIHEIDVVTEAIETVSTDQQDQNVSSSCGLTSEISENIDAECFSENNTNDMSMVDANISDHGLDLTNKIEQGVSVIHVTSSSDFSETNHPVLGYTEAQNVVMENNHSDHDISEDRMGMGSEVLFEDKQHVAVEERYESYEAQILDVNSKGVESELDNRSYCADVVNEENVLIHPETIEDGTVEGTVNIMEKISCGNSQVTNVIICNRKAIDKQELNDDNQNIFVQHEYPSNSDTAYLKEKHGEIASNNLSETSTENQTSNQHELFSEHLSLEENTESIRKNETIDPRFKTSNVSDTLNIPNEQSSVSEKLISCELSSCNTESMSPSLLESGDSIEQNQTEAVVDDKQDDSSKNNSTTVIKPPRKRYGHRSRKRGQSVIVAEKSAADFIAEMPPIPFVDDQMKQSVSEDGGDISLFETVNEATDVELNKVDEQTPNVDDSSEINKDVKQPETSEEKLIDPSSAEAACNDKNVGSEKNETLSSEMQVDESHSLSAETSSIPKEIIIQPPKKTYLRKRKQLLQSVKANEQQAADIDADIELFSSLDDNVSIENTNSFDKPSDCQSPAQGVTMDSKAPCSDEDSLSFSSDIRNKGSVTYKRRKTSDLKDALNQTNSIGKDNQKSESVIEGTLQDSDASQNVSAMETSSLNDSVAEGGDVSSDGKSKSSSLEKEKSKINSAVTKRRERRSVSKPVEKKRESDDIESDLNEMNAPSAKKLKTKKLSPYKIPETAFYPSTSVEFLKCVKSTKKAKRNSLKTEKGGIQSKTLGKEVILNYTNGSLTRQQLNNKLNEYNFSDSDDAQIEDTPDVRLCYSDSASKRKRSKFSSSKSKSSDSSAAWQKLVNSSPDKIKPIKFLTKIKRRMARLSADGKHSPKSPNSDGPKVTFAKLPRKNSKQKKSSTAPETDTSPSSYEFESGNNMVTREFTTFSNRLGQPNPTPLKNPGLTCFICAFECGRMANYIQHIVKCLKAQEFDHDAEVQDMDRRQQIRGSEPMFSEASSSAMGKETEVEQAGGNEENSSDCDIERLQKKSIEDDFGFAVDDIVWVEWKRTIWPSLVQKIHPAENKISVYFIDSPNYRRKQSFLKVHVKHIQSFNNAEINKKLLNEGKCKVHGEAFVKAVQKAEDFVRKKCLGVNVSPTQFFGNLNNLYEVEGVSGSETSDNDSDIENKSGSVGDMNRLVDDVFQLIKRGDVNDHLIGIYREVVESERHNKFFSEDPEAQNQLSVQPWFGPIENLDKKKELYDYVLDLFKEKCKMDATLILRYVYQVWCPEAIVKAISKVRGIPTSEAELIFKSSGEEILSRNRTDENDYVSSR